MILQDFNFFLLHKHFSITSNMSPVPLPWIALICVFLECIGLLILFLAPPPPKKRAIMLVVLFLVSLSILVKGETDEFSLKLLDESTGALCLDGTPGGFYLRPSPTNSPNWLIHFEGGGWCVNEQDCLNRAQTDIGSSAKWPAQGVFPNDGGAHGFLSSDPTVNPTLHDWNMVHINYCDGASYAGFKQDPIQVQEKHVYFRGAVILDEIFNSLIGLGLSKAENLIVGGTSA
jgi:hypothetical protein